MSDDCVVFTSLHFTGGTGSHEMFCLGCELVEGR